MTARTADLKIVDVDSHVAEPIDLWSSRMSAAKWGDKIPHVVWDDKGGEHRWIVGDTMLSAVGEYCSAGWPEPFPSHPPSLEEADPACWEPNARLKRLDEYGVWSQVLYPNIIAFDAHAFLMELGPEMATDCVRAYNDFLIDFASTDTQRLIPLMMLPFWDPEASVKEMHRARELGHKGILFAALFERLGFPNISDPQWAPVLSAAQDLDLSINFHIGFGIRTDESSKKGWEMRTKAALAERTNRLSFVRKGGSFFVSSAEAIADVIINGVCHDYPNLKFVSVESGFGYFPFMLEQLDWLWHTSGADTQYPERMLPSEYFRRQVYATFWHEKHANAMLEEFQDNAMFETDFPHETSLSPGPASPAKTARETVEENLASLSDTALRKVLYENAAKVYHLD